MNRYARERLGRVLVVTVTDVTWQELLPMDILLAHTNVLPLHPMRHLAAVILHTCR